MAKSDNAKRPAGGDASTNLEPKVVELAEQLGTFLGRVQAKAEGWLENETLRAQVTQIRDSAAELLDHVNRASAAARKAAAKSSPARAEKAAPAEAASPSSPSVRPSSDPVHAPGKRHRKPPPQESINKRMGEPRGTHAGQKQFRAGKSRGRG
jgi:hypothetical protein